MKTPFTYNGPLTFEKRLARLERIQKIWNIILSAIVAGGIAGLLSLFWRWL